MDNFNYCNLFFIFILLSLLLNAINYYTTDNNEKNVNFNNINIDNDNDNDINFNNINDDDDIIIIIIYKLRELTSLLSITILQQSTKEKKES